MSQNKKLNSQVRRPVHLALRGYDEFLSMLKELDDPLLECLFKLVFDVDLNEADKSCCFYINEQYGFFEGTFRETISLWLPLFNKAFGFEYENVDFKFIDEDKEIRDMLRVTATLIKDEDEEDKS